MQNITIAFLLATSFVALADTPTIDISSGEAKVIGRQTFTTIDVTYNVPYKEGTDKIQQTFTFAGILQVFNERAADPAKRLLAEASGVKSNKEKTVAGFNKRLGVDIYAICLVSVSPNGTISSWPYANKMIGDQIVQVDTRMAPTEFVLLKIDDVKLTFRYIGEAVVKPFDFSATIQGNAINVDISNLRQAVEAAEWRRGPK